MQTSIITNRDVVGYVTIDARNDIADAASDTHRTPDLTFMIYFFRANDDAI